MSFVGRVTRHPIPFRAERGAEAWAALHGVSRDLAPLIEGTASCSPFLAGLIRREAHWLSHALDDPPENTLIALLNEAGGLPDDEIDSGLRRLKRRAALLVALADLGGVWSLQTVTQAWTDFADACLAAALRAHVAGQARRGKIPGQTEEDAHRDGAGMVALAMGKMGAGELNYSSDIDLICLFDETRFDPADEMEARAGFIRATRAIAATLGETGAEGYVFRTDLRLRPDASATPVCISMAAAERYYEAEGRSWERSAYIKARAAAGAIDAGERFLKTLVPFVWRKHLDFTMVRDTMDMRKRIRSHKGLVRGGGQIALEGHDMKLGPGGIREIEFFAQTRQLVAGGRDPTLRTPRTVKALAALARKDWITRSTATELAEHYAHHREIEHRLQMIDDAQTHQLPKSTEGFDRLARFCGVADTGAFKAALSRRLAQVEALTEALFVPTDSEAEMPTINDESAEIVSRWPGYPALRSARGQMIFERLKPDLLAGFAKAARPIEALQNFDGFLRGLPAGVQLFSLFEAHPPLVELMVDIATTAPRLSRYLSRHSVVFDAVLDGRFFAPWPGRDALVDDLAAAMDGEGYEQSLDAARRWQHEWHFRIGVHQLRGLITPETAGRHYTQLADAVIAGLWPTVCAEIARRHGPAPGRGGTVIGMGSLGAGQMAATSDLDLIVVYDAGGVELTQGRRPLDPRGWFAKATKALVAALSAPTAAGKLYEVDMRLRPSGRQGPVATSFAAFAQYQREEAWTWEHMALTRARPIAGDVSLSEDIEKVRAEVVCSRPDPEKIRTDVSEMRARLAAAGRSGSTWAVKEGPGGLQDIELLAQAAALISRTPDRAVVGQLRAAKTASWLDAEDIETLCEVHRLMSRVYQSGRLLTDELLDAESIGAGGRAFLASQACEPDADALAGRLDQCRAKAERIIDAALPLAAGQEDGDEVRPENT